MPSITTVEHEGRQKKPSESLRGGERGAAEGAAASHKGDKEDLVPSKACMATGVEVDQCLPQNCQDQRLENGHVCSEPSKDPPADSVQSAEATAGQVAGDFSQKAQQTSSRDCHSLVLTATEKITSSSNVYDDEIWESSGAII